MKPIYIVTMPLIESKVINLIKLRNNLEIFIFVVESKPGRRVVVGCWEGG